MYSSEEQALMLTTAAAAIAAGFAREPAHNVLPDTLSARMSEPAASFVTLKKAGVLRGCIGSLEPDSGLLEGIARHARAAAFRDPRFPPLMPDELHGLDIEISILSPLQAVEADSEQALLAQMEPGEAGWMLQAGSYHGTFLPSVWSSLPDPDNFLRELKRKAGLPADYWSDDLRAWRYTTTSFAAPLEEITPAG